MDGSTTHTGCWLQKMAAIRTDPGGGNGDAQRTPMSDSGGFQQNRSIGQHRLQPRVQPVGRGRFSEAADIPDIFHPQNRSLSLSLPAQTRAQRLAEAGGAAAALLPLWHLQMEAEEDHPETLGPPNYSSAPLTPTRSSFYAGRAANWARSLLFLRHFPPLHRETFVRFHSGKKIKTGP